MYTMKICGGAQVEGVSCWLEDLGPDDHPYDSAFLYMRTVLSNKSESPVYNVVITCVGIQEAALNLTVNSPALTMNVVLTYPFFLRVPGPLFCQLTGAEWELFLAQRLLLPTPVAHRGSVGRTATSKQ